MPVLIRLKNQNNEKPDKKYPVCIFRFAGTGSVRIDQGIRNTGTGTRRAAEV